MKRLDRDEINTVLRNLESKKIINLDMTVRDVMSTIPSAPGSDLAATIIAFTDYVFILPGAIDEEKHSQKVTNVGRLAKVS